MGREFELKYKADGGILAAIEAKFGGFSRITMETAYFDTPSMALQKRRWMLRRRLENGSPVCTMKTPPVNGSRGEWNVEQEALSEAVSGLCSQGAPAELLSLTAEGLRQICAARFTRLAALVALPECTVEIALDHGYFLSGEKEQPFTEVEVELKEGREEAAAAFARALAREFHLVPEEKSKAQRAMELAGL